MIDVETAAKIASPIVTLVIGAILKHYTEKSPKLLSYIGHVSAFTLQDEMKSSVFTHSVIVRNAGRRAATNVRVGHHFLPINLRIEPQINYKIEVNPEGAAEIVIPTLVPKEQVTISYLYFPPTTWNQINSYTKSDDGYAKIVNVIPMPQPSTYVRWTSWILILIGASFVTYWVLRLALLLI